MRYGRCLVVMLALFVACPSFAGEKTGTLDTWLKDVRAKIEKIAPKKAAPQSTTGVSGVRGTEEKKGDPLYWKGKKENVAESEVSAFDAALALAEQGKKEEAIKGFEDFIARYPSSQLSKDAKTTIEKLKGL